MFDIIANYYCIHVQEKLMNQAWENSKNLVLGPILAPLDQIWVP